MANASSKDSLVVNTVATFNDSSPAITVTESAATGLQCHYIAFYPRTEFLLSYLHTLATTLSLPIIPTVDDLRISRNSKYGFAFNFGSTKLNVPPEIGKVTWILGSATVEPHNISIWEYTQS